MPGRPLELIYPNAQGRPRHPLWFRAGKKHLASALGKTHLASRPRRATISVSQPSHVFPTSKGRQHHGNNLRLLTTAQDRVISDQLYPGANYLSRLYHKMEKTFTPGDRLFLLVEKAYNAMRHLTGEVHYLTCESGVGKLPKEKEKSE